MSFIHLQQKKKKNDMSKSANNYFIVPFVIQHLANAESLRGQYPL